jgi:hypothetical protein
MLFTINRIHIAIKILREPKILDFIVIMEIRVLCTSQFFDMYEVEGIVVWDVVLCRLVDSMPLEYSVSSSKRKLLNYEFCLSVTISEVLKSHCRVSVFLRNVVNHIPDDTT